MSSQRVPGKVLFNVENKPLLQYLLDRVEHCSFPKRIIVATSNEKEDNAIYSFCSENEVECFRGSITDVAGRFLALIDQYQFPFFVRICGDSPLLDYRLIETAIKKFQEGGYDLVTNVSPRTYPKGQSVEVLSSEAFRKAYFAMSEADDFEHVTRYYYENPEKFSLYNFESPTTYVDMSHAVDTVADMNAFVKIIALMDKEHWKYSVDEIAELYSK